MSNLLLLGSGNEVPRKYILRALRERGDRVVLINSADRPWAAPLVTAVYVRDLHDWDAVRSTAASLHRARPFDGVLTYDEFQVELTAHVARDLGLPGLTPEAATRCRDKRAMREALRTAGVPSAKSMLAFDVDAAISAAAEIGYPLVAKPRNLGGSFGVVRADDEQALRELFHVAAGASMPRVDPTPGVLIEEYLPGPEFSVEAVVQDGRVHVCGITDKELGFAPYFEEVGHTCRPLGSDPRHHAIEKVAVAAHEALGVTVGATHCELRLPPGDVPHVIELAARLAGDKVPYASQLATGIDQVGLTVTALTGGQVTVEPTRQRVAGIRMIYPQNDGTVRRLEVPELASPPWDEVQWHARLGQAVALPPRGFMTRLGHVIAVADTDKELRRCLDAAVACLQVEVA